MNAYDKLRAALELATGGRPSNIAAKQEALAALAELERAAADLATSRDFYKRRCDALQSWQSKMRDPERTIVCDILANGFTLDPPGDRYTTPPPAPIAEMREPTPEECDEILRRYIKRPNKTLERPDELNGLAMFRAVRAVMEGKL